MIDNNRRAMIQTYVSNILRDIYDEERFDKNYLYNERPDMVKYVDLDNEGVIVDANESSEQSTAICSTDGEYDA